MKLSNILPLGLLLLGACADPLQQPVSFEATMQNKLPKEGEFYVADKGTKIQFVFNTNADCITAHHEIFNESVANLQFVTSVSWANNVNNLRCFISTDFPGLSKEYTQDVELVHNFAWTELTSQCKLPTNKGTSDTTFIDMTEYKNKKVVLAYCYKTSDNTSFQPMFVLRNLKLQSNVKKTGDLIEEVAAPAMAFTPFDALTNDSTTYLSLEKPGRWDVGFSDPNDKTSVKIRQTFKNGPLHESWIISQPVLIPRGKVQDGDYIALKNIHTTAESYTLNLNEDGEWTVIFQATNANYKHESSITQTFKFLVK